MDACKDRRAGIYRGDAGRWDQFQTDARGLQSLEKIEADTKSIGFSMGSERLTGALLRALAASKPKSKILELGTGTGISAAWLLDGMDNER